MKKNMNVSGWLSFFWKKRKLRISPNDGLRYSVSQGVINKTEEILLQYGTLKNPNEGFVYWGGTQNGDDVFINTVVAPDTISTEGSVEVSKESIFFYIKTLSDNNIVHIGQVHSHPSSWVDHSSGDDEWASFKNEGLVSIVVPEYGLNGMLPLKTCGVHRYTFGMFRRLSNSYISKRFNLVDEEFKFFDLRNKNDERWKK
ncbi:Mov34/MPN/PAD-1 family protein [Flagellimonas beolgyonensis]|uniref:Mov34/MPN/PAD-1 family protein n=1 Tax=Flagellimonas beolgyonensis TaxID=864064 RepID=UPI0013E0DD98|nr:Mov34/MPN/PAD-1 family protein [Allomuricauda beolgyonensis]